MAYGRQPQILIWVGYRYEYGRPTEYIRYTYREGSHFLMGVPFNHMEKNGRRQEDRSYYLYSPDIGRSFSNLT